MTHLDHPLFFTLDHKWSKEDSLSDQAYFEKTTTNGKLPKELQNKFGYSNHKRWAVFCKCLSGNMKMTCDRVCDESYKGTHICTTNKFKTAIAKFITKILNCEYSSDT